MESLVPAFVAALILQGSDRSPWLAATLADRYGRPLTVALAVLLALGVGNGIAALGGALVAPLLTPNARQLLLALALLFGAIGMLARFKLPDDLAAWRLGAFLTPLFGVFLVAAGDATQFLTFALAAYGGSPWLAATGAVLGAGVVNFGAALLGQAGWQRLPLRPLRLGSAVLALAIAAWLAAGALRLI